METTATEPATLLKNFAYVGCNVWAYAMGSYYPGTIKSLTAKVITVTYTSGAGKVRDKKYSRATMYADYAHSPCGPIIHGDNPRPDGGRAETKARRGRR